MPDATWSLVNIFQHVSLSSTHNLEDLSIPAKVKLLKSYDINLRPNVPTIVLKQKCVWLVLSDFQLKEESTKYFESCISYYFSDILSAANKYGFKMSP